MKASLTLLVAAMVVSLALVVKAVPAPAPAPQGDAPEGVDTLLELNGGIPGNACVTFRNNGEMVQADCVAAAADRKMKPVKINGVDALEVQREFNNPGFPIKLGKICVMNNSTHYRAEECGKGGTGAFSFVSFDGTTMGDATTCVTNQDITIPDQPQIRLVDRASGNCVTMTPKSAA